MFSVFVGLSSDEEPLFTGNREECLNYIDSFIECGHSDAHNWVILVDEETLSISSSDDSLF